MAHARLTGTEFARLIGRCGPYDREDLAGHHLIVVDGDDLPDRLEAQAEDVLRTFPTIVIGVLSDAGPRRPAWADAVVGAGDPALEMIRATVASNPLAATSLALLLRSVPDRTVTDGIVAESVTYGLLQGGPEFARWRGSRPVRRRDGGAVPAVLLTRSGDELSITLNRPQVRNAFDARMRDGLLEALHVAELDDSIASVVIRGDGPSFCSGGDLDEFGTRADPVSAHLIRLRRNPGVVIASLAERTVVHLHGAVVGSGIELAAFAGRVVAHPATRISLPEVRMGLIPGAGGTVSLPSRIGRHATLLLALGVESIDAATALDWGLVDEIARA